MRRASISGSVLLSVLWLWMGLGWAQDYSFTYTCDNQGLVIPPDGVGAIVTLLANTGAQDDTYKVILDKDLPGTWQSQACLPYGCFYDSASVPVASAQVESITVDIMPLGSPGTGTVTMRVRSLGDPAQTAIMPLTAITNTGVEVLVVDDDGTEDYEIYYQAALDSTGRTHGTLHKATTIIGADELAPFQAVVWFTGEAVPVLTEEDREALTAYLNGGGRLFISGQDIAYALCDTASGESDSASRDWFKSTFHVQYLNNDSDTLMLYGYEGDPNFAGISLNIAGGDGADNQTSPDVIESLGGIPELPLASTIFLYSGGQLEGAIRVITPWPVQTLLVYLAFGFEAIDNAVDRALVMERSLNCLLNLTPIEHQPEMTSLPQDFWLSPNYPNPFNASTFMILTIPGQKPVPAAVKIYNVLGQEVRTVMEGTVMPGSQVVVWDGRDDLGRELASGAYFSRLQVGNFSQTRKLVLTR